MKPRIRVLVVDDSAFMRTAVARTLGADSRIEIVGHAKDGAEAVTEVARLRPDVVTMDFNMPKLTGAEAIRLIFRDRPVPVVMLSAHTLDGARETLEALEAGAVDFVPKPAGEVSTDLSAVRDELLRKVIAAASARPMASPYSSVPRRAAGSGAGTTSRRAAVSPATANAVTSPATSIPLTRATGRISLSSLGLDPAVFIAISTGGPSALERVVPKLPAGYLRGGLIVQHMPAQFTGALAERLDQVSELHVREARDGDRLFAGTVLIAPGDKHVVLERNGMLKLTATPPVNGCRPSADVTLQSAVSVYGARMTVVVMTGMGRDGALGASAAKASGARILAQDRDTSVIWGMPKAVVELGIADEVLALDDIAGALVRLAASS